MERTSCKRDIMERVFMGTQPKPPEFAPEWRRCVGKDLGRCCEFLIIRLISLSVSENQVFETVATLVQYSSAGMSAVLAMSQDPSIDSFFLLRQEVIWSTVAERVCSSVFQEPERVKLSPKYFMGCEGGTNFTDVVNGVME